VEKGKHILFQIPRSQIIAKNIPCLFLAYFPHFEKWKEASDITLLSVFHPLYFFLYDTWRVKEAYEITLLSAYPF
jgi:hypothetical protein